jgi:hypothetical protein
MRRLRKIVEDCKGLDYEGLIFFQERWGRRAWQFMGMFFGGIADWDAANDYLNRSLEVSQRGPRGGTGRREEEKGGRESRTGRREEEKGGRESRTGRR